MNEMDCTRILKAQERLEEALGRLTLVEIGMREMEPTMDFSLVEGIRHNVADTVALMNDAWSEVNAVTTAATGFKKDETPAAATAEASMVDEGRRETSTSVPVKRAPEVYHAGESGRRNSAA